MFELIKSILIGKIIYKEVVGIFFLVGKIVDYKFLD